MAMGKPDPVRYRTVKVSKGAVKLQVSVKDDLRYG